jgi:periplasmic divalent cation tolerance protein
VTDSSVVVVLTTLPPDADAGAFGRTLVEERLAACVSVFGELRSIYRWKETIEEAREQQVVIKTVASAVEALKARVVTLHLYEIPEFLVLPVCDGGAAYLNWVRQSTTG